MLHDGVEQGHRSILSLLRDALVTADEEGNVLSPDKVFIGEVLTDGGPVCRLVHRTVLPGFLVPARILAR